MSADLFPLFFDEKAVSNVNFDAAPTFVFDFGRATGVLVKIDSGEVFFSLDGKKVHGRLDYNDDRFIALDFVDFSKIWFKGSGSVRFWAWQQQ